VLNSSSTLAAFRWGHFSIKKRQSVRIRKYGHFTQKYMAYQCGFIIFTQTVTEFHLLISHLLLPSSSRYFQYTSSQTFGTGYFRLGHLGKPQCIIFVRKLNNCKIILFSSAQCRIPIRHISHTFSLRQNVLCITQPIDLVRCQKREVVIPFWSLVFLECSVVLTARNHRRCSKRTVFIINLYHLKTLQTAGRVE
jgi:hypothetical protein